jgi:hypothetical protein
MTGPGVPGGPPPGVPLPGMGPTIIRVVGPIPQPTQIPYDPSRDRELARVYLAKVLVWVLAGTVAATFTLAGGGWVSIKDSLPVLTALIGVVGTALGFYFGGHSGGGSAPN